MIESIMHAVAVDPELGTLIARLFDLYATRNYSGDQLHAEIRRWE
jgi:hypothetical protein